MAESTPTANGTPTSRATEEIARDAARFERRFRRDHPFQWWLTLAGPPVVSVLIVLGLAVAQGGDYVHKLLLRALAAFFVFGKFAILEPTDSLSAEALFGLILYMDLIAAVMISFHMAFMFRLPWLGEKLLALASDGEFVVQAQPWIRRATFAGLMAFVMFPVASTGSIGGAILGRLLGLPRRTTFLGVALGSLMGCGLMYFGAAFIREHVDRDHPILKWAGIAAVAAVLWLLNARYRKAKRSAGY
jgi:uncharacterized membrane protein